MSLEKAAYEPLFLYVGGGYTDMKTSQPVTIKSVKIITLEPWEWRVHASR